MSTPVIELYHTVNSVCAQKVRVLLEEKGLAWTSRMMTLRGDQFAPAYLALNPNAVVPTLVHDGLPVIESSVILYYLDECFPQPALMPANVRARMTARLFNKLIDESVHNSCTILTFATALRQRFMQMDPAAREGYLNSAPNQERTAYKRDVIEQGLGSKYVVDAVRSHQKLLSWMATALARDRYLAGPDFSLADIAVIPYVTRLDLLGLSGMWQASEGVQDWYNLVRARPSVQRAILGSMTEDDHAPFANRQSDPWPIVAALLRAA